MTLEGACLASPWVPCICLQVPKSSPLDPHPVDTPGSAGVGFLSLIALEEMSGSIKGPALGA